MEAAPLKGRIRRVIPGGGPGKGFGFITAHDGKEYFCHRRDVTPQQLFRKGKQVQFEDHGKPDNKGLPVAIRVRIL